MRLQQKIGAAPPGEAIDEARCRCGAALARTISVCWWCELISRQAKAGFYPEHQGATLGDFQPELAAVALAMLEPSCAVRGVLVTGPVGTGKTRFLAAITAATKVDAIFGLARALIRRTWAPETQDAEIQRLASVPLLLLDDLGREGWPTDIVLATVHEVLSARIGAYRPTVVSSNLTVDQLAERYDDAIADWLRPWARVVLSGKSRR